MGVILGLDFKTLTERLVLKPSTRVLEGTRNNLKIPPKKPCSICFTIYTLMIRTPTTAQTLVWGLIVI